MKQMFALVLVMAIALFVGGFRDTVEPYWDNRVKKSWSLLDEGRYRDAATALFAREAAAPEPPGRLDVAVTDAGKVAGRMKIDLTRGSLNGRPLFAYTRGEIVAHLGSPTWVRDPRVVDGESGSKKLGAHIKYHWVGLDFRFRHPDDDGAERCSEVVIRTADQWDHEARLDYTAFPGSIAHGVAGDWDAERVASELLGADGGSSSLVPGGRHSMVFADHAAIFRYDRDSGLLRIITLTH